MRSLLILIIACYSIFALATAPLPTIIFKNQFGEQTNGRLIGGQFPSGAFVFQTETLTASGTISTSVGTLSTSITESKIANTTSGTVSAVLPAPTTDGQLKVVVGSGTLAHPITMAMTNILMSGSYTPTGTTTLTFTSVGDSAFFISLASKWFYLGGSAVAN